jgi:hypothetical protein
MGTRIHQLLTAALVLSLFFVCSEGRADPHTRDRFYFQLTSGLGWTSSRSTAHNPYYDPPTDYTNQQSGWGLTGSILLGLPLRPGLALGVGGLGSVHAVSSPNHTENGQPVTWEDHGGPYLRFLGAVGPFVDYYPSAALGWHVQALVGYATLGYGDINPEPPTGIGLMAGIGHDWWVSDRWSIGALARLVYASTHVASMQTYAMSGHPSEHDSLLSPSLEVTFTHH